MTFVKQVSLELGGCQAHVKERSISPTCVRPLIDEVGEGEGLSLIQLVLPQRLSPLAASVQHTTETQQDWTQKTNLSRDVSQPPPSTPSTDLRAAPDTWRINFSET